MIGWVLLFGAFAGSAAGIALLFVRWFEPRGNVLVLFGNVEGLNFYPSAFDAAGALAAIVAVLALTVMGSVVAIARGVFFAWTVGAGAAIGGALVCLILRESPPSLGAKVYTPPELAFQPTATPLIAMAGFLLAAACLTVWALGARARRA